MNIEEALVVSNENVGIRYFALTLAAPRISEAARPGQFVMIAPSLGLDPFLKRPMGINVIDSAKGQIRVVYRVVGRGTDTLSKYHAGDKISLLGPAGHGWDICQGRRALLIGGGSGIAPMLPLATELACLGLDCEALLGASSAQELACVEEFARLCHFSVATLDGSLGIHGPVTQLLPPEPTLYDMVYCCGPKPLMHKVALWAELHDLPCQVSLEEHMGCGFGVCMGCVCPTHAPDAKEGDEPIYKRVCCEGPVFDSQEVVW